ncbi:MAG: hypothetical protein LBO77_01985 [Desulfovibrio sp.]|jgi:hypothetical protein|nr:hypothetical protein [Desulfovibrio sp.]
MPIRSKQKPVPAPRPDSPTRPAFLFFPLFLLLFCLAACAGSSGQPAPLPYDMPVDPPDGANLLTANTYAGDALSSMLLQRVDMGSGILATSLVRLDTLDDTSSFGRLAGQQIASRIAQHGFLVLDVRLTHALTVSKEGEFMLSRDMGRLLAAEYNAHAVLVGTYSPSGNKIFVSARVLRLADGAALAAYEYHLPYDSDAASLLAKSGIAAADAVWRRYTARGQAFAAQPAAPPRAAQAAGHAARNPAAPAPSAPRPAISGGSAAGAPLPEQTPLRSGGKRIQP